MNLKIHAQCRRIENASKRKACQHLCRMIDFAPCRLTQLTLRCEWQFLSGDLYHFPCSLPLKSELMLGWEYIGYINEPFAASISSFSTLIGQRLHPAAWISARAQAQAYNVCKNSFYFWSLSFGASLVYVKLEMWPVTSRLLCDWIENAVTAALGPWAHHHNFPPIPWTGYRTSRRYILPKNYFLNE